MAHPAIEFLDQLDPSPEARFNIETYTDKKDKPKPDPLYHRFSERDRQQVEQLLPELEALNTQGAAIYVAVNQFVGHRKLANLQRVRGIHADLDNATGDQLQKLREILSPSLVVQSSSKLKQHWYWLLAEGEELDADTAKALNQALVGFGADRAAVEVARLLRLPGFRNMKLFTGGRKMLNSVSCLTNCPVVTLREQGTRYTSRELLEAFSPKGLTPTRSNLAQEGGADAIKHVDDDIVADAIAHIKATEPSLWEGNWADNEDPLTGEKSFPSQSEADYHLARQIARRGTDLGVSGPALELLVGQVFEQSELAKRDKWKSRADYRERTIRSACTNLTPRAPSLSRYCAPNPTATPDWSLKGDLISARFFSALYVGKLVFVTSVGKWLRWDDGTARWISCELGEHIEAAKATVLDLYRIACFNGAKDHEGWKNVIAATAKLQVEPRIKATLELAKSEPGMSIRGDTIDAHPELLGVRNGVVNLRTGTLRHNEPSLFITKYLEYDYNPTAPCPIFTRFLDDIFEGDAETISTVQQLLGLTLTGCVDEEVLIFCVGTGANGKSIFGNVISSILGQYSQTAPSSLLAARRADDHSARSDLAMLQGARLVSINELPGGMTLDENVAKQLAGREPISARFLYKEHFTFLPRFTPWVRTNHRPIIKGTDNGIWRRMVIIPFRRTFAPAEQDKHLEKKLMAEAEGILAWMAEGARLYLKSGIRQSAAIKSEVARYRTDSDLLGEFLSDKALIKTSEEVKQAELYASYRQWCELSGLKPVAKRSFSEQLGERGIGQRKSGANRYYTGVSLARAHSGG